MTIATLILASSTAICPGASPADTYPVTLLSGCPAPSTGLLYPVDHEDRDARMARAALDAATAADACADRLDVDDSGPGWLMVAGALMGAAVGAVAVVAVGAAW